jgi:hypothetical protein
MASDMLTPMHFSMRIRVWLPLGEAVNMAASAHTNLSLEFTSRSPNSRRGGQLGRDEKWQESSFST